ncbi:MAG: alpha-amylase [Acidobacteria bacterium]|nr:alpha-amylase [Acidobacteriota bacterium]MBI3657701.1 alpha-amylase [Acidobacteriota bacterium]
MRNLQRNRWQYGPWLLLIAALWLSPPSGRGRIEGLAGPPSSGRFVGALASPSPNERYNGLPTAVMLQGFHWESCNFPWYKILKENANAIRRAGFDYVWFPPPSKTADCQGYLPNEWYDVNTRYGTAAELKAAIRALKPVQAIADVVVNHRTGTHTAGADFTNPAFKDNRAAVVQDDECQCGTGARDSGESAGFGRDLDHSNPSVQKEIGKWLRWLKSDIGFAGWRYDMVKGYGGSFVGLYNEVSKPVLSVGEYFDYDRQKVVDWIDATRGKSAAFDFPTRKWLKEALEQQQFGRLKTTDGKPTGVIGWWPAMSVTFIENHDTEPIRQTDPFPGDKVMQGYAYILTHPGIPCVFWRYYFDWGDEQKQKLAELIKIRKQSGIHSRSLVNIVAADNQRYAAIVDGKVAVKIGPGDWSPGNGWRVAIDGPNYAVWTKNAE